MGARGAVAPDVASGVPTNWLLSLVAEGRVSYRAFHLSGGEALASGISLRV